MMLQLPPPLVNKVSCMDACELMRLIPAETIDLIVTSPPYDNLRTYNGYSWNFEAIAHASYRVLKRGGVLVWVVGDSTTDGNESLTGFEQALYFKKHAGFKVWDTMIWNKFLPGDYGKRYCQAFEYMFVLAKGTVNTFNPIMRRNISVGKTGQGSQRNGYITQNGHIKTGKDWVVKEFGVEENVWRIQNVSNGLGHPAAFPDLIAERHILTWSNPGDIVLDYFGGSGTTAVAARNLNRRYIVGDSSPEYCAVAEKRLSQAYTPNMFEQPMFRGDKLYQPAGTKK